MDMLVEDDDMGLLVRAVRCDGAHDRPTLASRRLLVNGTTFDCCARHLRELVVMARVCGSFYYVEPITAVVCGRA